jgi:hypothetical protein
VGHEVYDLIDELWEIYHKLSIPDKLDPSQARPRRAMDLQSLLHLTALVSCGLPVSSFEHSKRVRNEPVFVEIGRGSYLTIVSSLMSCDVEEFFLAQADNDWNTTHYVLTYYSRRFEVLPFPLHINVAKIHNLTPKCECSPGKCTAEQEFGASDGFNYIDVHHFVNAGWLLLSLSI